MAERFELWVRRPVEADWGVAGLPRVIERSKLVGFFDDVATAAAGAAAHAGAGEPWADGGPDGDYAVRLAGDGRMVARVAVRQGLATVESVPGGQTPAERVASLHSPCPLCGRACVPLPCARCGAKRCVGCMARRVCCGSSPPPEGDS